MKKEILMLEEFVAYLMARNDKEAKDVVQHLKLLGELHKKKHLEELIIRLPQDFFNEFKKQNSYI